MGFLYASFSLVVRGREINIGMWSEESPVVVVQVVVKARSGEHSVRSGEVGAWSILKGSLVGLSGLFRIMCWSKSSIII